MNLDGNLARFLFSIFTTAQVYRDNDQAMLPSYRERIVQIRLRDDEKVCGLAEFRQMGGILAAHDARSSALLWTLKVYDNRRDPAIEGDIQDVFFKSMAFDGQGLLVVENERGERFAADTKTRTATRLP